MDASQPSSSAPLSSAAPAYFYSPATLPSASPSDRGRQAPSAATAPFYPRFPYASASDRGSAAAAYLHRAASDLEMLFDRTTPSHQPGSEQMYGEARNAPTSGAAAGYLHPAASDLMLFDRTTPSRQPGTEQMYGAAPNAPTSGAAAGDLHPTEYMLPAPIAANYHAPPYATAPANFTRYTYPSPYAATTTSWAPNYTDYPSSYAASPSSWTHATAYNASARPVTDLDARMTQPTPYARAAYSTSSRPAPALSRIDSVAAAMRLREHDMRSQLLVQPLQVHWFFDTHYKRHILSLLGEGGEQFRQKVLATVTRDVHRVMVHPRGCDVFQALVRCCTGRCEELRRLVQAISGRNRHRDDPSWRCDYKDDKNWIASMKITVSAVSPYHDVSDLLIQCLNRDDLSVFKRRNGNELLEYCFDKFSYEQMQPLILHVLAKAENTMQSSTSLVVCFDNARGQEMSMFEKMLINRCRDMATATYSHYFLQHAIKNGGTELKKAIVQRLMQDAVALSNHKHGRHVVQECLKTHDAEVVRTVLDAFCGLTDSQLVGMVRGSSSKYVLQMLLDTGYMHCPQFNMTMKLAQRLTMLPGDILSHAKAQVVATSARRILYSLGM